MVVDYLSNNSYTMSMKSHLLLLVVQTLVLTVAGQTSVVWNSDIAIQTGTYSLTQATTRLLWGELSMGPSILRFLSCLDTATPLLTRVL